MKKLLLLLLIGISFNNTCNSQNLEAHYKVVRSGEIPLGNGETKSYSLDYQGLIYHSGNRTISFLRPQYLLDYPDGEIKIVTPSGEAVQGVRMDSIQSVTLYDMDSVITWNIEGNNSSIPRKLIHHKIRKGTPYYKYFDDTKTINGLLCKHAFCYYPSSDKPWADIWYYPEYNLPYSFFGVGNLPGLLVQGDFYNLNFTFSLISLKTNEPIDESVFMPWYFEQPAKSKTLQKKESRNTKKRDIMKQ